MTPLLWAVVTASAVGSLHCAGMCGGFVAFYAGADRSAGAARWIGHLAYNGGRMLSYLALGALAGLLGAGLDLAGSTLQLRRTAALIAGALMVSWGLLLLLPIVGVRLHAVPLAGRLARTFLALQRRLGDRPPVVRALALGAMTTLLPCGWLYAFVLTAGGTGSAAGGAAVMLAFWAGTLPVLLALGAGVQRLVRSLGRLLPALTACALIAIGALALVGRLGPAALPHEPALSPHGAAAAPARLEEQCDHGRR